MRYNHIYVYGSFLHLQTWRKRILIDHYCDCSSIVSASADGIRVSGKNKITLNAEISNRNPRQMLM